MILHSALLIGALQPNIGSSESLNHGGDAGITEAAGSSVLDFTFTGQLYLVGPDLGSEVQIGDTYSFRITYDAEAPLESFVPTSGSYPALSATLKINTSAGTLEVELDATRIELQSQSGFQRITFTQQGVVDSFELNGRALFNPQLTMFSDQNPLPHDGLVLPTSFDRADYNSSRSSSQLSLAFGTGFGRELIKGTVDAVNVTGPEVPDPALPTALANTAPLGDGWLFSSWFNSFRPVGENWVYHASLGFLFLLEDDSESFYVWDLWLNRWLWTSESAYPFMYAFGAEGGWVYVFEDGVPGSRVYARAGTGELVPEGALRLE